MDETWFEHRFPPEMVNTLTEPLNRSKHSNVDFQISSNFSIRKNLLTARSNFDPSSFLKKVMKSEVGHVDSITV